MIDLTYDPRAALEITRYHTWRRMRDQSVGEHSCQIQRIMLCIRPDTPRKLLVYAIFHDIGEPCGDIPYPFKKNNPNLKREHRLVEGGVVVRMQDEHGVPNRPVLTEQEEDFFKMCENIEMWEYGVTEVNMGNQYAVLVAERMILVASTLAEKMPEDIKVATKKYINNRMKQESPNV